MSGKIRVPQHGKPGGFHTIDDPHATRGAIIGRNVYNPDGSLFEPGTAATPAANNSDATVIWKRVMEKPANVTAVAALATDGFVRRDAAGAWAASGIVNADLTSADTDGLAEGALNLYFTDGRADARIDAQKGVALGLASLDADGKLDGGQLPALAITDTYVVADEAAMLALTVQQGDVAVRSDLSTSYILTVEPASVLANWQELLTPTAGAVTSFNGRTGSVTPASGDYTAAQVGADPAGTAAAIVAATITNGDTTHAPSGDAVFDALAGKVGTSGAENIAGIKTFTSLRIQIDGGESFGRGFRFLAGGLPRWEASAAAGSSDFTFYAFNDAGAYLARRLTILRSTGDILPGADNAQTLGSSSERLAVVYAATGAINTSDAREKDNIRELTPVEIACAIELAAAGRIYQWRASVAEKGGSARLHCSPTVQSVIAIMESHGLDPFRYGFVCYDEWGETPEQRDPETGEVTQEYRPAGDRYSLRPSELESFIAAGLAKRLADLESRLTALGG